MTDVAAIGERARVAGLVTAGVAVYPAEDPDTVRSAWRSLPDGVGLVIVTAAAAAALGQECLDAPESPLTAVMPP